MKIDRRVQKDLNLKGEKFNELLKRGSVGGENVKLAIDMSAKKNTKL